MPQTSITEGVPCRSHIALRQEWTRRGFFRFGAAAAAGVGLGGIDTASAHNLPKGQFGSPGYDAALRARAGVKGVFQSPNVESAVVMGKDLNHLLLIQLKNWLNGFQFSYEMAPRDLHTVVATCASANLFTYGDAIWQKYRMGEKYNLIDPVTGAPVVRNVFWPSRFGAGASTDPDNPQSIYQDTGIEGLQKRGSIFLT